MFVGGWVNGIRCISFGIGSSESDAFQGAPGITQMYQKSFRNVGHFGPGARGSTFTDSFFAALKTPCKGPGKFQVL